MIRVAALIRMGSLCRTCSDSKCRDLGSDAEPIEIECPSCNGSGCDHCNQGAIKITGCPNDYCRKIADATHLIDLYERGLPPVAGGALDQAAWFIEAARRLKSDESQLKAMEIQDAS